MTLQTASPTSRQRPPRWFGLLLLLALLQAQTLGLLHRTAHAPSLHGQALAALEGEPRADADGYGHAPQSDDCRLYDQLALGELLPGAVAVLVAPPAQASAGPPAAAPPATAAGPAYRARAPPSFA